MLSNFSNSLRDLLKGFPKSRPFVCEGNPFACEVFIVGFNAATEMEADFWDFWSDAYGFDKKKWFEAYIQEKRNKPLIPPKKRRNELSNTRQRIEWISQALKPHLCLETNLYFKATEASKDLGKEDRRTTVFEFLIKKIKPKVLFIHGVEVRQEFEKLYSLKLKENEMNQCELFNHPITILPMTHLSRGWSKEKAEEIGKTIKDLLTK
jgi:hypothetical protein